MEKLFNVYDERLMNRYSQSVEAELICRFLEQWGMVQGKSGAEDSSGRAKIELMPVADVVDRAFEMASLAVARLQSEGHLRDLGELKDRRFLKDGYDVLKIVPVKTLSIEEDESLKAPKVKA